jgi:integrase
MRTDSVAVPVSSVTLCRYVAYLAERLGFASIAQYINIIRLLHLECGYPNPLSSDHALHSVLQGIKRVKGNHVHHKEPITPALLLSVRRQLDLSNVHNSAFWAACLLLFFGLFRKSNVLVSSLKDFNRLKHLSREDLTFHSWGISVIVRWSKTIQCQERILHVPLIALPGHPLCPVTALINYIRLSVGASLSGPAFTVPGRGNCLIPLSSRTFTTRLRSLLSACGVPPEHFATHSFRRGGATWALQCGLPPDVVRMLGDWRSDAYLKYIDLPLGSRVTMAKTFACSLPLL